MANHLKIGKRGEEIAVEFLQKKGYSILECNWRYRRSEIDIIVMDGEVLVFVEVKTRTSDVFGKPESFVTDKKRMLMMDASSIYMEEIGHDWEIRFDVVSVLIHSENHTTIEHFIDAFFTDW